MLEGCKLPLLTFIFGGMYVLFFDLLPFSE